jgi:GDP-mannose 6-dehydrogenase
MKTISIFGLGYVGSVTAACFARQGNTVVGVEISPLKVELFRRREIPITEPMLPEIMAEVYAKERFRVTDSPAEAVRDSEISFVCVGTPSQKNGDIDLSHLSQVAGEIGEALRDKNAFHTVVIRSTVFPGTIEDMVIPAIESASGKTEGQDFGVVANPEFMREGTAVKDFDDPPFVVIGERSAGAGRALAALYGFLSAPVVTLSIRESEMVKYLCNAFHALKITFANEVGQLSKVLGVDSQLVMDVVCRDTKLNISPKYLRPGPPFGGSCLPKDLRMLNYGARRRDLDLPLVESMLTSNTKQIGKTAEMIMDFGERQVGMIGLTFKESTDDIRESPPLMIAEMLIGKGHQISIFDPELHLERLTGVNKQFLEEKLPHINSLLTESVEDLVANSKVLVVCKDLGDFSPILDHVTPSHIVVDLGGWLREEMQSADNYYGLYW